MNHLNSIILEGTVSNGSMYLESEKQMSFTIEVHRTSKDANGNIENIICFFEIESCGRLAEICKTNCRKGRGVRIVGRLKQCRWTDKDGKSQSKVVVFAEHIEFKPMFKSDMSDAEIVEETLERR